MCTCLNASITMSEQKRKEKLVEHTPLDQSYNYAGIQWDNILESKRTYQVRMDAPRLDSINVIL